MPYIDPKAARGVGSPGVYLAEVVSCNLKTSKKNQQYFNVELVSLEGSKREALCWDVFMLEGKGASVGIAKMQAFGFFLDDAPEQVEAHHLIGKRAWVRVGWQTYTDSKTGETKRNLKPLTSFEPFDAGFYPESLPPEDAAEPLAPIEDSDPFAPDPIAARDPVKDSEEVPF